jgi:biotin synthase
MSMIDLVNELCERHALSPEGYAELIDGRTPEVADLLASRADAVRRSIYGNKVFVRGLIEISNVCKNDCLYCGIRRSNRNVKRYRLDPDTIVACARDGYEYGYRTIVLQGGEDTTYYTDDVLCDVIARIVDACPNTAVTMSMGERGRRSFERMFEAGATRYLLRHETATREHYERLHPSSMSFDSRMRCLHDLKEIGYQVGCGFMVGSPFQTLENLFADLQFIRSFQPEMVGIGPFIPTTGTPFADRPSGTVDATLRLLAIIRLLHPRVLLPATTALGTLHPQGRELGILAGANVIMPNLSPAAQRADYSIYDNKLSTGSEAAETVNDTRKRLGKLGVEIPADRGDYNKS